MRFSSTVALASLAPLVAAASIPGMAKRNGGCANESIVSRETLESGVVVTKRECHDKRELTEREREVGLGLEKRDTEYLCPDYTTCGTTCYAGSGGPNQNDCTTIQNAILSGNDVQIGPRQTWTYTWNSCEARFFNQNLVWTIDICPSAFAGTVQWLAGDCNGAHGAQGGKCISTENTGYPIGSCGDPECFWPDWFIDVIHS